MKLTYECLRILYDYDSIVELLDNFDDKHQNLRLAVLFQHPLITAQHLLSFSRRSCNRTSRTSV